MPRPATENQKDCDKAIDELKKAYRALDVARQLITGVRTREEEQHGSTGRTDRSVAARNRTAKAKRNGVKR